MVVLYVPDTPPVTLGYCCTAPYIPATPANIAAAAAAAGGADVAASPAERLHLDIVDVVVVHFVADGMKP